MPLHRDRALVEKLSRRGSPSCSFRGASPGPAHRSHFPPGPPAEEVNAPPSDSSPETCHAARHLERLF